MSKPLVFISYSHMDEAEKDRLLTHLGVLRPDLIDLWSDDDLFAGDHWENAITQAIGLAKVAILLVTANFLNSGFILREEVPRLLKRRKDEGLVVFPVIAKACAWRTVNWLREMQVRPKYGAPVLGQQGVHVEEDLAKIAEEVATIIAMVRRTPPINPDLGKAGFASPEPPAIFQVTVTENLEMSKVLIVDDDALFRRAVIDTFDDTDITFVEAESVDEAKALLTDDHEIQIILLDLKLPGENGTKILEHIIDRVSEYRVIVLTGHDELLPSREAAVYRVFQYLSKSERGLTTQSLRFAVEQARQDIERERLAKLNQEAKFDDVILNKYPTPFTYIYQELKSDLLGLEILTRQRDIFKLLLNVSAVALMCEYFEGDGRNDALDTRIRGCIYKPTFSDWFNIISEIIERKDALQTTFFLDRFSTFFTDANRRHLESLIEIFERYLDQAVKLSEFEYQEVTQRCDGLLVPLLQDYQFITDFLLCHVSSVQKVRGEYKYRMTECTGANPQLLFSRRDFSFLMNSNELHLVNLGNNQFRSMHPFTVLEHCGECKQWEIFFYAAFTGDQLHYKSYKTGHSFSTVNGVKDLRALIGVTP